ncbi:YoaK family protein [Falsirhodobacter sp. 1013]|uniref:YoaK family protein n=1 Tax=Falsirhodobacter sp. 1013 TaxID=3417566 RepID=UPI003EC13C09
MHARQTRAFRVARLAAAPKRTPETDRSLGILLAGIAGSLNVGGFLLLSQYTSHMTGHLSNIAGSLVFTNLMMLLDSLAAIGGFVTGAAVSAAMIAWGQTRSARLCYALPLGVQGALLAALPLMTALPDRAEHRMAIVIVCFVMGLQNATITRISGARIRTSHATGLITDMGIEIGRSLYHAAKPRAEVPYDGGKLWLYVQLVAAFIVGGVLGAIGHGMIGWAFAMPPGLMLITLAVWSPRHRTAFRGGKAVA